MRRGVGLLLIIVPSVLLFAMVAFLLATRQTVKQLLAPGVAQRSFRMGTSEALRSVTDQLFTEADIAMLSRTPHVKAGPASFFRCGTDPNNLGEMNCGYTNRVYYEVWADNIHVTPEALDRWDRTKDGVIVSPLIAAHHNWHVGDHISLRLEDATPDTPAMDLEISAIPDRYFDPRMVYFHTEYRIQHFPMLGAPRFWVVWAIVDQPENRQAVMDDWNEKMKLVRPHIISTMEATTAALLNGSRVLRESFEVAGILSALLVVFLSVALTTLYAEQRTTEMAAMGAIGYRRGTLALAVLLEGLITLPVAALIGAMLVWIPLHDHPLVFEAIFRVGVHLSNVVQTLAYGAGVGLLSAAVPAWRVYRLDILKALR